MVSCTLVIAFLLLFLNFSFAHSHVIISYADLQTGIDMLQKRKSEGETFDEDTQLFTGKFLMKKTNHEFPFSIAGGQFC